MRAASYMMVYNNGYSKKFSICSIREWSNEIHREILEGISLASIGANLHRIVISQTESAEREHHGYINHLFQDAVTKKGSNSGFF